MYPAFLSPSPLRASSFTPRKATPSLCSSPVLNRLPARPTTPLPRPRILMTNRPSTAAPTSTKTSSTISVTDVETFDVVTATGARVRTKHAAAQYPPSDLSSITTAIVPLPVGPDLPIDALDGLVSSRPADARLYALSSSCLPTLDTTTSPDNTTTMQCLQGADVVVFAHGFSQLPRNYASTLSRLACLGYVVLAPTVWVLDVLNPFVPVAESEGTGLAGKLQTALLIDVARCVDEAERCGARRVHLLGHSMGGATVFAYAQHNKEKGLLESVIGLAPAVEQSQQTKLNPLVSKDGDLSELGEKLSNLPTLVIHGRQDRIVNWKGSQKLFDAFANSSKQALTGLTLIDDDGSHVGFEDALNVDIDLPIIEIILDALFLLIDLVLFQLDGLGTKEQLSTTKVLLEQ